MFESVLRCTGTLLVYSLGLKFRWLDDDDDDRGENKYDYDDGDDNYRDDIKDDDGETFLLGSTFFITDIEHHLSFSSLAFIKKQIKLNVSFVKCLLLQS